MPRRPSLDTATPVDSVEDEPGEGVTMPVRVALERRGGMWRASPASEPRRAVVAHNTKTARRLISQSLRQGPGEHGEIAFDIVLPEKQRAALEHYLQEQRQAQPGQSLLASRVACAKALLALQLTQEEVAELMGISRPLLAVSLHRAASRAKPRHAAKAQGVSANLRTVKAAMLEGPDRARQDTLSGRWALTSGSACREPRR